MDKKSYVRRQEKAGNDLIQLALDSDEFKKKYECGKLKPVQPLWHTDMDKIKIRRDKEHLKPSNTDLIINNIDVDQLLKSLDEESKVIFMEKTLFNNKMNSIKTYQVVTYWTKRRKLIPPRIFWEKDTDSLRIEDGRHRLNAAYCYGVKMIPVVIYKHQFSEVVNHLGIDSSFFSAESPASGTLAECSRP